MKDGLSGATGRIDRRDFLGTGAGALAAAATLGDGVAQGTTALNQPDELPRRPLGRTGVGVTILNIGAWLSPGGDRLLRYAWANASATSTRPRVMAPSR